MKNLNMIKVLLFFLILYVINYFIPLTFVTYYKGIEYRSGSKEVYVNGKSITNEESPYLISLNFINSVNGWGKKYIIIPFVFKYVDGGGPYKDTLNISSREGVTVRDINNLKLFLEYQGKELEFAPYVDSMYDTNSFYKFNNKVSGYVGKSINYTVIFKDTTDTYKYTGVLSIKEENYFGSFLFYIISQQ